MTGPIATGSGIERVVECAASAVLPRVWRAGGVWASRGIEIHAYLERIANGTPAEESLVLVPEEFRDAAGAVDLPELAEDISLSAEVAFAYNPVDDTACEIGRSLARDYSSVTEDEIPLTIDVAGLAGGVGIVRDYKTGWTKLARTRGNWQMRGAAIAVARAFKLNAVDAQLIYLRDGRPVWRDHATFDSFDLATIAAELRATRERVLRDREAHARGEHVEPTQGPWCRYCPSWSSCPTIASIVRWTMTGEADQPVQAGDLVAALSRVDQGIKTLERLRAQILATIEAADEPLLVEVAPDGTETWLGKHPKPGNEKLDAAVALDIAIDVLAVPADHRATFVAEVTSITKAALERAVKARVARGQAAHTIDRILTAVRARGGATRPTTDDVGLFTRRPALDAGGK